MGNTAAKLGPGIDTRGENGYVVAPPSFHANGNKYYWDLRRRFAVAPERLLQLMEDDAFVYRRRI